MVETKEAGTEGTEYSKSAAMIGGGNGDRGEGLEPQAYTRSILGSYDAERHIGIEAAYALAESAGVSRAELQHAVEAGKMHTYKFKGKSYIDRLDIGRIYHRPKERFEGLTIDRFFTDGKTAPLDTVEYETKHVEIAGKGKVIFSMDAEFPKGFTDNSASIVAQKYFYKPDSADSKAKLKAKIGMDHEHSLKHLVTRVTNFVADSGGRLGYFKTEEDKRIFAEELMYMQINRMFAFNSPVQFNAGLFNEYGIGGSKSENFYRDSKTGEVRQVEGDEYTKPQCHACFIKGPRDDLDSILNHTVDEGRVFAAGSGIGQDIGTLRGEGEPLSGGGKASGPISFMRVYDDGAGTIKSGGKSRRAARMTTMRYTHPDSPKFIRCKVDEDRKAWTLIKAGYDPEDAYSSVGLQNTNLSVRLDKEFFDKVQRGEDIELKRLTDGKVTEKISAKRLLQEIAFGSWRIGDPGVQYETPIQEMHTCKNSGRINSSNPCSEYMFLNDTSCNLASTNLLAFCDEKGNFDVERFSKANRLIAIAADILNDAASYPIRDIAEISPEFRSIGVGYANLGALLMRRGLAYDSDEGRNFAKAVTSLMTGTVYEASAEMAEKLEPFMHFEFNKGPMLEVISKHKKNLEGIVRDGSAPANLVAAAEKAWGGALEKGMLFGYRNAQGTVLAPTGTIAFLMDCDTTGIEPAYSLKIRKKLSGGGSIMLVNNEVQNALRNMRYTDPQIADITEYIGKRNCVIGAPHLNPDHYSVFATAAGNEHGEGSISFPGHVKMLGATQPFISGAISKTNNMPQCVTVKDVHDLYLLGHNLGLKAISVFRAGSKPNSPLSFGDKSLVELKRGEKRDLPGIRVACEAEVKINGTPLHVLISEYPDGTPGQIVFLSYTSGSTMKALLETHGISSSKSLKRGVKLEDQLSAWLGQAFEPRGLVTGHPFIKTAVSPLDFAAKFMLLEYTGNTEYATTTEGLDLRELRGAKNGAFRTYRLMGIDDWTFEEVLASPEYGGFVKDENAALFAMPPNGNGNGNGHGHSGKICQGCGNIMIKTSPNCYSCTNCGDKQGGCGQ